MVRKREEFGVRGDGDVCRRRKRRSEVWSLPGPRRLAAFGRAVAALPICSDAVRSCKQPLRRITFTTQFLANGSI